MNITKVDILTRVDQKLGTELLDKFYSVNMSSGIECRIQGKFSPDLVLELNEKLGIDPYNDNPWEVDEGGFVNLSFVLLSAISGCNDKVNLEITLA